MSQTMKLLISQVKPNPDNPRVIKDDKYKKLVLSLKDFPEMAGIREVVVNKDYMILGGNMRFKAMVEAGWKEIPVKIVDLSDEKQKEFIIKDNNPYGEWDWDVIANQYELEDLGAWGVEFPHYEEPDINLPEGEKDGFQQMTFTLTDEQAAEVTKAVAVARDEITGEELNENSNGNAIYYVAKAFNEHS